MPRYKVYHPLQELEASSNPLHDLQTLTQPASLVICLPTDQQQIK